MNQSDQSDTSTQGPAPAQPGQPAPSPNAGSAAKKSPLEILEEILAESQQKAAAGGEGGPQNGDGQPLAVDEVGRDEAARQEALAAEQEAAKLAQDKVALEQKIAELKALDQTPENQARLAQLKAEAASHDGELEAQEGFEIRQVSHDQV